MCSTVTEHLTRSSRRSMSYSQPSAWINTRSMRHIKLPVICAADSLQRLSWCYRKAGLTACRQAVRIQQGAAAHMSVTTSTLRLHHTGCPQRHDARGTSTCQSAQRSLRCWLCHKRYRTRCQAASSGSPPVAGLAAALQSAIKQFQAGLQGSAPRMNTGASFMVDSLAYHPPGTAYVPKLHPRSLLLYACCTV